MQLRPKRGRSVPDPVRGDLLPSEGRNVEESSYSHRRIADGDVEEVSAEEEKPAADAKKKGGE
jgi:hypothetical protein